jgi:PAS domain S-box-containing protein
MKLRRILSVLALLAFLSASIGGYLYYHSLREFAFKEAERQGGLHAKEIRNRVSLALSENQKAINALSSLKELQIALLRPNEANLTKANLELDHFHDALEVSVCYLMDKDGNTIASSNRNDPDSFVGKNYGFRPYFRQAIKGTTAVYMALGVTSIKRGVYFSHPVYVAGKESALGVVVIKASVASMEAEFSQNREGIALLTDPHGVIFVSSRKDWLYRLLWRSSPEAISEIAKTRQFGRGPWNWTGLKMKDGNRALDLAENEYLLYQMNLDNYRGWSVIYLVSLSDINQSFIEPLIKTSGSIILISCILIGSAVFLLYREANDDIVQRKRTEEALRESEKQYRNLVDYAPVGIYKTDLEGNILYVNDALIEIMGFASFEEMKSSGALARYKNPNDRNVLIENLQKTGKVINFEVDLLTKSGTTKNVMLTAALEENVISGMIMDVTERKQAVGERIRLATAVEQAAESVIIADRRGTIQYVNPAFEKLSGFTPEDIVGQNFGILKSDRHDEAFYREMWQTISSGKAWAGRINNRMNDGTFCEFETIISPIRDSSGAIVNFVSVNRDVTQEIALEAQLLQAQKMEAVGTLAGGIAHDFNNLLQVIQGYTEVLLHGVNQNVPSYDPLKKIHRSAKRGADLTRQLLTLSRKVQSERKPLDLNHEVEQMKTLLERTIPKMIEIELYLSEIPAIVNADPVQVEQTLMNLAVNAMDAMSEGGRIIIETENVTLDEEFCRTHLGARPGEYVLLSISDNGHGMNEEILEHVFEPFYTTKEVGKGTGLGLAMVYGIVKNHEGYILCYSEPHTGTTFKIYLPAMEQDGSRKKVRNIESRIARGTEIILLVDDEEYIRELGEELLGDAGYTVLTASNGEGALRFYEKEKEQIDLVILDLVIPGMGGKKCYEEILKINPQAKILIVSGYSANGPGKEALEAGAKGFVGKPFDVEHMLETVRAILDQD